MIDNKIVSSKFLEILEDEKNSDIYGIRRSFESWVKKESLGKDSFAVFLLDVLSKLVIKNLLRVLIPKEALKDFLSWGFNLSEIGDFYGVSKETVSKRVKEYGLGYMLEEKYDKKVDKDTLKKLLGEGHDPTYISGYFGVPSSLLYRLMKRWDFEILPVLGKEELENFLDEGKTFKEIEKEKGGKILYNRIVYLAREYGLWDKRNNPRQKFHITKEQFEEVRDLSVGEKANHFGCSKSYIYLLKKKFEEKI